MDHLPGHFHGKAVILNIMWKQLYCFQHLQTDESNGLTGEKEISDLAQKQGTFIGKGPSTSLHLPIKIRWSLQTILTILSCHKTNGSHALTQVHLMPNASIINPAAACDIH